MLSILLANKITFNKFILKKTKKHQQLNNRVQCFSISYLSNSVDFLLVCLSDVQDAGVGQGDGRGALQGRVYRQLTEAVVDAWHLAVHGPTCYDAHLWAHPLSNGRGVSGGFATETVQMKLKIPESRIFLELINH